MHGTYRGLEYNSELYVFTRLDDVEALVASFPSYPLFEYAPRRTMPQRLVMQIVPCAMACAIAGATQIDTGSRPGISSSHNEVASALVPAPNAPELAARPQRPTPGVTVQRQPVPVSSGSTDTTPVEPAAVVELELSSTSLVDPVFSVPELPETFIPQVEPEHVNEGGKTELVAMVDGAPAGNIVFSDENQVVSVQLGSLLSVLESRFDAPEFERLASSPAAGAMVPVEQLAQAGIDIRYDPVYDEFVIDTGASAPSLAQEQAPSEYS